jgi:hypothetical protein
MPTSALKKIGDLGEFLTDSAKALAQDKTFDYKKEETAFNDTFDTLDSTLGDNAFRRFDRSKKRFVGGFSVSAFEAVAIGIGYSPTIAKSNPSQIEKKIQRMWASANFVNNSGSGIRASSRVPKIVPFGREEFAK